MVFEKGSNAKAKITSRKPFWFSKQSQKRTLLCNRWFANTGIYLGILQKSYFIRIRAVMRNIVLYRVVVFIVFFGAVGDMEGRGGAFLKVGRMASVSNSEHFSFSALDKRKGLNVSIGVAGSSAEYVVDGIDDEKEIQQAIDDVSKAGGGTIRILKGVYHINPNNDPDGKAVHLKSHVHIVMDGNARLVMNATNRTGYALFAVEDVRNVMISGGVLVGERDIHKGRGGEWGMGIRIDGATDVTISHVRAEKFWGDGFYIGATPRQGYSENVVIRDSVADGNRRQGLSIISGRSILIENFVAKNTDGTAPRDGIDVEPDSEKDYLDNIVIKDYISENNAGYGLSIHLDKLTRNSHPVGIVVDGMEDRSSSYGIKVAQDYKGVTGYIRIENVKLKNAYMYGVAVKDMVGYVDVVFRNILIQDNNVKGFSRISGDKAMYGSSVLIYGTKPQRKRKIGNVRFEDLSIFDTSEDGVPTYLVYMKDRLDCKERSCDLRGVSGVEIVGLNLTNKNVVAHGSVSDFMIYNPRNMKFLSFKDQVKLYKVDIGNDVESKGKSGYYPKNTVMKLRALPVSNGRLFSLWSGDVGGVDDILSPRTILKTSDADVSVTAVYK